jgi:hypothetical protein
MGVVAGAVMGFIAGCLQVEIPVRAAPNEGTRRSGRNALIAGLASSIIVGVVTGYSYSLTYPDEDELLDFVSRSSEVMGSGLLFGLLAALIIALANGGLFWIRHYVLRIFLWREGIAPLHYVRFLDYAVSRIFLRRSGGGYLFVHRTLREYFQNLPSDEPQK